MELSLIVAALLLGLSGLPHCVTMCAAPCAAVCGPSGAAQWAFQLARIAGYAAVGAIAAYGVAGLALLRDAAPLLQPLWVLLHAGAFALGVWMLFSARAPEWRRGRTPTFLAAAASGQPAPRTPPQRAALPIVSLQVASLGSETWQARNGRSSAGPALRSGLLGAAWVAWPCGLLQSALLIAALANTPVGGATAMAGFALVTAPALWLGPRLLRRIGSAATRFGVRAAGLLLAGTSAFALGHGLWQRVLDWCMA